MDRKEFTGHKTFIKVIVIIIAVIVFLIILSIFIPKLKLQRNYIELDVFEDYNPIDYSAYSLGKNLTSKVRVDGEVDNTHVGKYKVTYDLKEGLFHVKKELTVEVTDKVAPEIELKGDAEYKVCSYTNFEEPGYSANDNYDGDLTDKVEIKQEEDIVEYSVLDSSNNKATATRKLIENDDSKPEITLNGDKTVYITKGNKYEEKGAIAIDNCDGELTDKIVISGEVNTDEIGTYEITYTVADSKNNESTEVRKVVVQNEKVKNTVDRNDGNTSGVIYLTFDDGPGSYTNQILDTLKKYGVKATFFVTKSGSDATIKREYDEGHTVALHTASHAWKIYSSVDDYFKDLNAINERVKKITGQDAKYIRFPGGSSNTVSRNYNKGIMTTLTKAVEEKGYKYFDWNVDVNDAGGCAYATYKTSCVLKNFKSGIIPNGNSVVLMHDIKSYTASALEDMIKYAKGKGYIFKAIDDSTPTCHHRLNN